MDQGGTATLQKTHGRARQAPDPRSQPLSPGPRELHPFPLARGGRGRHGPPSAPQEGHAWRLREQAGGLASSWPIFRPPPARPVQTPHGRVTPPTWPELLRPQQLFPVLPATRLAAPRWVLLGPVPRLISPSLSHSPSLRFSASGEMGPLLSRVVLNIHVLIKEFYCRSHT